ncbi:UDP-N-acetylglucosamine transferase subunit ALG14 -like protein [Sarcoptes scabiei]|uniref:UDP-N-acetylglucosamine transferase subunit ALG14 n=1 Tax=Sarcoptes scabiei TaxID=52283 RepID=A0A834REP8_SARSC|nr:UDP-N-acetylglucosamine transferase subunit ALG14 -like protein [Sarcoptes scabiei]
MISLILYSTILISFFLILIRILIRIRNGSRGKIGHLMSVLGSGGHTHEMITLLDSFVDSRSHSERIKFLSFVISEDDRMSSTKLQNFVKNWQSNSITKYAVFEIKRSRKVQQSYISSIWTTIIALYQALGIVLETKPEILLCNGPGVCLPLIIICKIFSPSTIIVFVESFCRTRTLSLTGKIVYHLSLADHFLVQWPKLKEKYHRSKFMGLLV